MIIFIEKVDFLRIQVTGLVSEPFGFSVIVFTLRKNPKNFSSERDSDLVKLAIESLMAHESVLISRTEVADESKRRSAFRLFRVRRRQKDSFCSALNGFTRVLKGRQRWWKISPLCLFSCFKRRRRRKKSCLSYLLAAFLTPFQGVTLLRFCSNGCFTLAISTDMD